MSNIKQKTQQFGLFGADQQNSAAVSTRSVLVPYPVDKAYDYALADGMKASAGDLVCVPLGPREIAGVVWGDETGDGSDIPRAKLKTMVSAYDVRPLSPVMLEFVNKVAAYTMTPLGSVLKMVLSAPAALEPPKPVKAYKISAQIDHKVRHGLSPQRSKVLEVLSDDIPRRPAEIADLAGCSAAVVKGMADKGLLDIVEQFNPAPCQHPDPARKGFDLSEEQDIIAAKLRDQVREGGFHASLLDGVTGAGKTEVYFEAIAEALKADKQVLLMLPEIALSNAFLDRFKARFGCAPALWHSGLTPAQRRNTWRGVVEGQTKVVVGARSALFLPYPDLGLIVADEEHDPAYKQEDGVIYHARDMAVMRAHLGKFPIVLVSATPSLETMQNVWDGRYTHLKLPSRYGGSAMPDIHLIDMREDKPERGDFIAPSLKKAAAETLERGEQVLFFLNRRGYAPLTLCRSCGHRFECPRCTAWLTQHKSSNRLECHHCGFFTRASNACPSCSEEGTLAACGPGVERIYEEAKVAFPDARIILLASDTVQDNEGLRKTLNAIRDGEYDIIIGTQIIAKGHHFPNLTCVGVIDADLGLDGGELRAAERTYQLLHQVAGRAGRAEKDGARAGHVYLQSFMPDHRIMQALAMGLRDPFLKLESSEREESNMPPFSRLAGVIVAGRDLSLVEEVAKQLGKTSPQGLSDAGSIQTLGPAPAVYARLRGKHRMRLLVRADKTVAMQKTLAAWIGGLKIPSSVRVYIDIDPQSFF